MTVIYLILIVNFHVNLSFSKDIRTHQTQPDGSQSLVDWLARQECSNVEQQIKRSVFVHSIGCLLQAPTQIYTKFVGSLQVQPETVRVGQTN